MKSVRGENGRILIFVLVIVLTLSVFWVIALRETGSELRIIGGKKSDAQEFFDAEASINIAIENLDTYASQIYNSATPYDTAITFSPTNSSGEVLGVVTIRTIDDKSPAPGLPNQIHEYNCGGGTGITAGIKCRRYGIHVDTGNKEIQVGVWQRK